ncbi:BglG family transcription antiterminator [Corticicoccus populi]|uniref:BglG family transcription antiterminator n=1 Tax=Corticicoccus populi TaxID=1812821 RepID=A0ABW5WQP6_9STAP
MSQKENREQKILMFLSKNEDYVTSESLADLLSTSQKTIYRLIKKINDDFDNGLLILSEKGRGYKLDYEKYIKSRKGNLKYKDQDFSPEERRNRVMEELLLSSPKPINIFKLYNSYYVGDSVIFTDEQVMSEKLRKYNLVLERKNRTLSIIGDEVNIRKAVKDSIEIFNVIDIDDLKSNESLNFNRYDVLFILDQLRNIERELDITIPYPYNVNIFSHLYIILSRSRKQPSLLYTDTVSDEELKTMKNDLNLYQAASSTINHIEKYLNQSLPEIEVYFLYQYLVSSRMQGTINTGTALSPEVIKVTEKYISEMSIRLGIHIDTQSIFLDLANHIKPMLNRLEHNIRVNNSLLDQIKVTYEQIFLHVKEVSDSVSRQFGLKEINDDENGFVTLYFAKIIETTQFQQPIKTLIMCTTGIGTSELLKAKVSKKFSELEIVDVVSTRDLNMFIDRYSDVELVLSTIHIDGAVPKHFLLVSAMFTNDDQRRLQKVIEAIYHER